MLRLLKKTETVDLTIGGTTFTLRPQSHGAARALRLRNTKRGRVDEETMAADFWKTHLVGWKGLADVDGNEVPFPAAVEGETPAQAAVRHLVVIDVVDALPDDVISLLTAKIREPLEAAHRALGNGTPSSANAS